MKKFQEGNETFADSPSSAHRRRFLTQMLAVTGGAAATPALMGGLLTASEQVYRR